jgi:hypothetical protein
MADDPQPAGAAVVAAREFETVRERLGRERRRR